ncbi:Kelch repeat-containing protein [Asticcacaulis tiandongensis]|uniref:Kelch repeat-containing protein n=1 Tax=Asticcacaulis tiandongensis TaxID=2565365 RepID=UPI0011265D64|nr:kelch repeat-containing protein [Asticcacaulis tiandongensis]
MTLRHLFTAAFAAGILAGGLPLSALAQSWHKLEATGKPTARHESAAAHVDGRTFVIGGRGDRPLDILDHATNTWSVGAAPPSEMNHMQAIVHEDKIYIIGALHGPYPEEEIISHVWIYDPKTDVWSQSHEIPADRRRGGAGLVVSDGLIYFVGGNKRGHNSGFVPYLDAYDPATGQWTTLPDAPRPRDHVYAAVLDGKIYAAGGRLSAADTGDSLSLTIPEVDVYDIATQSWSTTTAPIPTPRAGASAITANNTIIILGGESAVQVPAHSEVEAFDPQTGTWQTLPPMPVGRHGFQALVIDGNIHVIAGSGDRGGGPELSDHWVLK